MFKRLILFLLLTSSCSTELFNLKSSSFTPSQPISLQNRLKTIKNIHKKQHYALLLGGGTEERHRNNISMFYQILLEQGYKRNNIFILESEGGNPPIFPLTDNMNIQSLDIMMKWLSINITNEDTLLIYITGHGLRKDNMSYLILNKAENISKDAFRQYLDIINPQIGILITDQCYWGLYDKDIQLDEWIIITSTTDHQVTSGSSFIRNLLTSYRLLDIEPFSINDAYLYTLKNDPMILNKKNNPNMSYIKNDPKNYNVLGEKIH